MKGNGFKDYRYYMHASDVRYFLRRWVMQPYTLTEVLEPHIRVGKANQDIWILDWTRTEPAASDYTIQDPELAAVWGYIIGREMAGAEMTASVEGVPKKEKCRITNRNDKSFFQYFGSRQK